MVIMVTYDLNRIKDYDRLYNALTQLGEYIRDPGLDSVWFIDTTYTLYVVETYLFKNIDADDRIFICKIVPEEHKGWLNKGVVAWLSTHVIY